MALLPVGLESARDSLQESAAINVLSEVIADRQATPMSELSKLYSLPALTNTLTSPATSFFGITAGNQVTQLSQARYRIDYTILPPPDTLTPYQAWFKVSWPAPSANPAGSVETVVTFPQP